MNKLYKRAEFLRKFLEYHGLYWKVEVIKAYAEKSTVMYLPMYRKTEIKCRPLFTIINNNEQDLTAITNDHDVWLDLSYKLLTYFLCYYDKADPVQVNLVKNIKHYFKYDNTLTFVSEYERIDFEHFIQNLILDGIPLDEFPSIEDVI